MKRTLYLFGLILLTSLPVIAQQKFEISLKNNTPAEAKTKAQLERLIKSYDLDKWIFTRNDFFFHPFYLVIPVNSLLFGLPGTNPTPKT
jgi:hypothetical protein